MLVYINTAKLIGQYFFLFGIDENTVPVYICIYNHATYFYVKTNYNKENLTKNIKLKKQEMANITSLLKDAGIKISKTPQSMEMYDSECFSDDSLTHYKIFIDDINQMQKAKKVLNENHYSLPEHIEMSVKILTDLGIKMCQWIEIDEKGAFRMDFTETISERKPIQFVTRSIHLKPVETEKLPPAELILNIDAEAYSSRYGINGSRAHPDPLNSKDVLYCYSLVLTNSDTKEILKSYNIMITKEDLKIDNGEIVKVNDEEELFMKFSEIINRLDPDMITGYNIQGFDFNYMKIRSDHMLVPSYGRLKSFDITIDDLDFPRLKFIISDEETYISKSWEGAGKSWHSYVTPECYGRVVVDTFNLVKPIKVSKGAPGALQSHKLNDVGKFLTGKTKEDITYAETYMGFRSGDKKEMERIASYCVQDSVLNWEIFNKMNGYVYLREAANMFLQDQNNVLISGLNAKIKDNYLFHGEKRNFCFYSYGNKKIFKIKGGHVEDPMVGKRTNVACIDFSSMYPSAQMARNICLSTFSVLRPDNLKPDDYYEFDIDVEIDELDLPAYYEDFIQLYDDTKIEDAEYNNNFFTENALDKIYMITFLNLIREKNKIPTKKNTEKLKVFFVKPHIREGIFPRIEKDLKDSRNFYKKQMKAAKEKKDSASYEIYDQRQKLVKVVMNSIYGIMGSPKGVLSCMEASAAITHFGRECIKQVRDFLVGKGCTIVYGDTDSVMIQIPNYVEQDFNCPVSDEVVEYVEKVVEEINNWLPPPMQVEFEKVMNMVPVKKKHYLGVETWKDGKKIRETFIKGLAGIRGDSTPFAQQLFRETVKSITENVDGETIKKNIFTQLGKLVRGEIPNEMLVVSTMLAHAYKSETAAMNVYSKYLKSIGEVAEAGTKISFLVVKGNSNGPKSFNFRPADTQEELDYDHYYKRAIDPLKEIMMAAFNISIE